jgi:tetratricopeptide (TPR) repeat protein
VIGHYESLRARFPNDRGKRLMLVRNYLELVSLLWEYGQQNKAAEPFSKAFKVDKEDPEINNKLAWFLATCAQPRLRNAAEAARLAQKAVRASPKSADFWNTLGVARYRNGDDKGAIADLETAMKLRAGGDAFDWFFLAMIHCRRREPDKAKKWFDRAVQWMDRYATRSSLFRRFRAEAEAILGGQGKP